MVGEFFSTTISPVTLRHISRLGRIKSHWIDHSGEKKTRPRFVFPTPHSESEGTLRWGWNDVLAAPVFKRFCIPFDRVFFSPPPCVGSKIDYCWLWDVCVVTPVFRARPKISEFRIWRGKNRAKTVWLCGLSVFQTHGNMFCKRLCANGF